MVQVNLVQPDLPNLIPLEDALRTGDAIEVPVRAAASIGEPVLAVAPYIGAATTGAGAARGTYGPVRMSGLHALSPDDAARVNARIAEDFY